MFTEAYQDGMYRSTEQYTTAACAARVETLAGVRGFRAVIHGD